MASKRDDSAGDKPYTPDEFDDPPEGPVGVHRGPRSMAVRITPIVVIVLLAALCGVGAWAIFLGGHMPWEKNPASQNVASTSTEQPTKKAISPKPSKSEPSKEATQTPSETPSPSESSPQPEPQPSPNKGTQIRVVNGTSIAGYAGSKREVLVKAGYSSVVAANPTGSLPQASVVWYQSEADKVTAEDVAKTLGIANVQQVAGVPAPVVAVLLQ